MPYEWLLRQRKYMMPWSRSLGEDRTVRRVTFLRKIVDEADCISTQSVARDTHVHGEADELLLVDCKVLLDATAIVSFFFVWRRLILTDGHAEKVFVCSIVHEDFAMREAKKFWQTSFKMAHHRVKSTVFDKANNEINDLCLHLVLDFTRNIVWEDLNTRFSQHGNGLADIVVILMPEAA